LTGQDFVNVIGEIKGDFALIPQHVIKSDEPVLLDGMTFDELKSQLSVPVIAEDLISFLERF